MTTLCFDTETTGLPRFDLPADDSRQPRICSVAMVLLADAKPLQTYYWYVRPDGWTVPDEVAAIHGLSNAKLTEDGIPIREVLEKFCVVHDLADQIMGYNCSFDLKLLRGELRRCAMNDRYGAKPVRDIMKECTDVCRLPGKRGYKWPKLSEAVNIMLGREHVGAHDAMADVCATIDLASALDKRAVASEL